MKQIDDTPAGGVWRFTGYEPDTRNAVYRHQDWLARLILQAQIEPPDNATLDDLERMAGSPVLVEVWRDGPDA